MIHSSYRVSLSSTSSSWSWASVVRVVCPAALAVPVVTIGSCWLFESAADEVAVHGVPFQAVLCRCEPSGVVRGIVVVTVNFVSLLVFIDVVFPFLGWSSLHPIPFLFG